MKTYLFDASSSADISVKSDGIPRGPTTSANASPTSYEELAKLAIRYSDGVVVAGDNVSPTLVEYAKSLGKPVLLKTTDEEHNAACNEFYETVIG